MKIITIVVTRSKSCHVKALHTILRLNIQCLERHVQNEITFCNDDPYEKADIILSCMKKCDRLLFIDFGIGMDVDSINQVFNNMDGIGCLVFPGVLDGIDWGLFKSKVLDGSTEPTSQMGLNFDTEVGKKVSGDIYTAENTIAKVFVLNCKLSIKKLTDKNGLKILPKFEKMYAKFKEKGLKIYAYTASKLIHTYNHECISNILNAAGVRAN